MAALAIGCVGLGITIGGLRFFPGHDAGVHRDDKPDRSTEPALDPPPSDAIPLHQTATNESVAVGGIPPAGSKPELTLLGTGFSKNGEIPYAVIQSERDGSQRLYREGETIQNARIAKIGEDKVVLTCNGRNETLRIDRSAKKNQHPNDTGLPAPPRYSREELTAKLGFTVDIQEVKQLMAQIALEQHLDDNTPDGVKVIQTQPNSIFEKAGLKADDIITAVDWKNIDTMDDSMEIYESLRSSSKGTLQIVRDGNAVTLHYYNEPVAESVENDDES